MKKKETGNLGETIAAQHLSNSGYTILQTKWRKRSGEIDIIAEQNNTLVFAEVKTRKSIAFENGNAFVGKKQRKSILATANIFLEQYSGKPTSVRFDILNLIYSGNNFNIHHIEDAYLPGLNEC